MIIITNLAARIGSRHKRVMSQSGQRENLPLTALRGLASAWVVAHHVQPTWFPGAPEGVASVLWLGQTAVDIFFVLSGFILACVYGRLPLNRAPVFWLRRVCRIYPLHLVVLATFGGMTLAAVLLHRSGYTHDWRSFWVEALLLHPFLPGSTPWNPPTWSLGIEMLCYALFPFVVRLFARAGFWMIAAIAVGLAAAEFYVLPNYGGTTSGQGAVLRGLAGFHLGMALGFLSPWLRPAFAAPASLAATAGLAAGIALVSPVAVVLSAAVLIIALSPEQGPVARLLSTHGAVWLGHVSFSIYLLHAPLFNLVQRLPLPGGHWSHLAVLVAVLLPLSDITYRWIERPGRRIPAVLVKK
jgi:peptidoglycan/LPS O-acetylase OafA/YrhL